MNLKEFFKKYGLIVFLVVMIVILGFIKINFGNKSENTSLNEINNSTQKDITNIEDINTSNIETQAELVNQKIISTESGELSKEILKRYSEVNSEEEFNAFFKTLTPEEQEIFSTDERPADYYLIDILPYEENTFIIEKYLDANILSVKTKGDNFDKSKDDLMEWLNKNAEDPENITIVWGEN